MSIPTIPPEKRKPVIIAAVAFAAGALISSKWGRTILFIGGLLLVIAFLMGYLP